MKMINIHINTKQGCFLSRCALRFDTLLKTKRMSSRLLFSSLGSREKNVVIYKLAIRHLDAALSYQESLGGTSLFFSWHFSTQYICHICT